MRIAALIQVHHRPDLLNRLLERLAGPGWACYVHVDRKSDIGRFRPFVPGVHYLDSRVAVYWAGFSQVAATLRLMRAAYADTTNTHFYLMSGQCYPMLDDAEIVAHIARSGRGDLISLAPMPFPTKSLDRLQEWHLLERMRYGRLRRGIQRLVALWPARDVGRLLHGIPPYAGWNWWLLSRETVGAMLALLEREPWFERAFRHSLCADEMFFQTLFAHLGLVPDGECPTAASWTGDDAHPAALDHAAIAAFRRSGRHLMARKVVDVHPADRVREAAMLSAADP